MRGFHPWRSAVFRQLRAVSEGLLSVAGGGAFTALFIWKLGLPSAAVLRFVSGMFWCFAAFAAGRRAGLHARRRGALEGLCCGGLLWLCRLCGAVLLHESPAGILAGLVMLSCAGCIGGIIGVNTKLRKPPD